MVVAPSKEAKESQAAAKTLTNSVFSGDTFFGIKVPSSLKAGLNVVKGMLENELSHGIADSQTEKRYKSTVKDFAAAQKDAWITRNDGRIPDAKDLLDINATAEKNALKSAREYGAKFGTYAVIAVKLIPTALIGKSYFMAKRDLSAKIDPLANMLYPERGFFTFGHSQNRILSFASDQVHKTYNAKLLGSLLGFAIGAGSQKLIDKEHQKEQLRVDTAKQTADAFALMTSEEKMLFRSAQADPFHNSHKPSTLNEAMKILPGLAEGSGALIESSLLDKLPDQIRAPSNSLEQSLNFIKRTQDRIQTLDPLDKAKIEKEEKLAAKDVADLIERIYLEAGWSKMPETVSDEIETVTRAIVRPMLEGRLEPAAVVKLLGEDKIITRQGSNIIDRDELDEVLEDMIKTLDPAKRLSAKAFFEQPGIEFRLEDVTNGWEQLLDSEKSLFALLLSEKVLIAAGAKKDEIAEYLSKAEDMHPSYEEQAAMALLSLAELPEEDKRKMFGKSGAAYVDNAVKEIQQAMKEGSDKYDETISHVARLSRTKNILATVLTKAEPGKFTEMIEAKRAELDEKAEGKAKDTEVSDEKKHAAESHKDQKAAALKDADDEFDMDADEAPHKASGSVSRILAEQERKRGEADSVVKTEHKGSNEISKILAKGAADRGKADSVIADRARNRDSMAELGKH